jgi:hypothetical protein
MSQNELDALTERLSALEIKLQNTADDKQTDTQNLKDIIQEAATIFKQYHAGTSANQRLTIEKDTEYQKHELDTLNQLDRRDKWYKGLSLALCLIALAFVAYFDKLQGVGSVIGVIIGALLRTDSITAFFAGAKSKTE